MKQIRQEAFMRNPPKKIIMVATINKTSRHPLPDRKIPRSPYLATNQKARGRCRRCNTPQTRRAQVIDSSRETVRGGKSQKIKWRAEGVKG